MALFVTDPAVQKRLIAERRTTGADRWDEVWDGVYVLSPLPNNLHQEVAFQLALAFHSIVGQAGGRVLTQVNVSDRAKGWKHNYRQPDVVAILPGGAAVDRGTHFQGGPDLVVEILSPHDRAREKVPFYAAVGVRECLIVDRDPWALELYQRGEGGLVLTGRSDGANSVLVRIDVLPVSFRLVPEVPRPLIELVHHTEAAGWRV